VKPKAVQPEPTLALRRAPAPFLPAVSPVPVEPRVRPFRLQTLALRSQKRLAGEGTSVAPAGGSLG
jgi:hypothetical protein